MQFLVFTNQNGGPPLLVPTPPNSDASTTTTPIQMNANQTPATQPKVSPTNAVQASKSPPSQNGPVTDNTVSDAEKPANESHSSIRTWMVALSLNVSICHRTMQVAVSQSEDAIATAFRHMKTLWRHRFPSRESSVLNTMYQILSCSCCCTSHAIKIIRFLNSKIVETFSISIRDTQLTGKPFSRLPVAVLSEKNDGVMVVDDWVIIRAFRFLIDTDTGNVICQIPPSCITVSTGKVKELHIVVAISSTHGLGPGVVIFPNCTLDKPLQGSLANIPGDLWLMSVNSSNANQIVQEFMNTSVLKWLKSIGKTKCPEMVVDQNWWNTNTSYDPYYTTRKPRMRKSGNEALDPVDVSVGITVQRLWGLMIRDYVKKQKKVVNILKIYEFPEFIYDALRILCEPSRISRWLQSAGYCPNTTIQKQDEFWQSVSNIKY